MLTSQPVTQQSFDRNVSVADRLDYFADQITPTGTPTPSILADDGVTLRLVPGGMIALPANSR
jgi:hypothetical protein